MCRQASITGVPGFPSHPCQTPKRGAGLMQLHSTAHLHQYEPKHMSKISALGFSCARYSTHMQLHDLPSASRLCRWAAHCLAVGLPERCLEYLPRSAACGASSGMWSRWRVTKSFPVSQISSGLSGSGRLAAIRSPTSILQCKG